MSVATACAGVRIDAAHGTVLRDTIILENVFTDVVVSNSHNCLIAPVIKHGAATGAAAVQVIGVCTANIYAPVVMGKASANALGIQVIGNAFNFTGALAAATSGTLTTAWPNATGAYLVKFSDGSVRDVTFTNGATTATWTGAVTATASANYSGAVRSEFNLTGIDSACIAGGAANKMKNAGASITATGLTGTSLVSGVVT